MFNDLTQLADLSSVARYPKHAVIITEGDTSPYSMYIILQGEVRVVKNYGQPDQALISVLKPGDSFGEMSVFLQKSRSASVITSENSVLLELTEDSVSEIVESNPKLLFGLIKTLCERIDFLNNKVPSRLWR